MLVVTGYLKEGNQNCNGKMEQIIL